MKDSVPYCRFVHLFVKRQTIFKTQFTPMNPYWELLTILYFLDGDVVFGYNRLEPIRRRGI